MRSSNLATASLGVNDAESMVVSTVWLDIFSVRLDPRVDERSLVDSFNWGGDCLAGGRTSIRKRAPLSISLRQKGIHTWVQGQPRIRVQVRERACLATVSVKELYRGDDVLALLYLSGGWM